MATPSAELLLVVVRTLDSLGLPYCVGGSLASIAHGVPRSTLDADLVIDLKPARIESLAAALEPTFYVSRESMREAVKHRRSFNVIHPELGLKIDFFVLGTSAFDLEEFRRRIRHPLEPGGDVLLALKTPEDTILRKLQWYRMGGEVSENQWRDVLGVLGVQRGRLDEAYLDRWAKELGVTDLLGKARREAPGAAEPPPAAAG